MSDKASLLDIERGCRVRRFYKKNHTKSAAWERNAGLLRLHDRRSVQYREQGGRRRPTRDAEVFHCVFNVTSANATAVAAQRSEYRALKAAMDGVVGFRGATESRGDRGL